MLMSDFVANIARVHSTLSDAMKAESEEWEGDPPASLLVASVGHALRENASDYDHEIFKCVCSLIEQALVEGDEQTRNAVSTSLLENLQNYSAEGTFDFSLVAPLLGEQSKRFCRNWDQFTGTTTKGL